MTPEQRRLRSQAGAHTMWANTLDRTARTAAARKAAMDRFERQVDPDGALSPAERAKRADNARQAHMTRMALASSLARAKRKKRPDAA
jgi:hypothetical protein